jgi:hypothetical protein
MTHHEITIIDQMQKAGCALLSRPTALGYKIKQYNIEAKRFRAA